MLQRIESNKDDFSSDSIRKYLSRDYKGIVIFSTEMTVSTNNDAKEYLLHGGGETALFVSDAQSGGRGRLGHTFHSPKGCGIYMTLSIPMSGNLEKMLSLTPAAAVAVCRATERLTDKTPMIKWVNDIFLGTKKLCGILCEGVTDTCGNALGAVVGIGMNFRSVPFPEDIADIVCALDPANGLTRSEMIAAITEEFLNILPDASSDIVLDEYRSRCMVLGKNITYIKNDIPVKAKALSIGKGGELIVKNETGETEELSGGGIRILFD